MTHLKLIRATLLISAPYNFIASYMLVFPDSALGQFIGLPESVPVLYATLLSFIVFLFGLVYAWMALQEQIDRSLLTLAAIAKAGMFIIAVLLWFNDYGTARGVLIVVPDLIFALIWGWWLIRRRSKSE